MPSSMGNRKLAQTNSMRLTQTNTFYLATNPNFWTNRWKLTTDILYILNCVFCERVNPILSIGVVYRHDNGRCKRNVCASFTLQPTTFRLAFATRKDRQTSNKTSWRRALSQMCSMQNQYGIACSGSDTGTEARCDMPLQYRVVSLGQTGR